MPRPREDYSDTGVVLPFPFPGSLGSAPQTLGPFIFPPRGRPLTPEERFHEGFHARWGGIPSLFSGREAEEKAAYEAENQRFPGSSNPYNTPQATPQQQQEAASKQAAERARMDALLAGLGGGPTGGPNPSSGQGSSGDFGAPSNRTFPGGASTYVPRPGGMPDVLPTKGNIFDMLLPTELKYDPKYLPTNPNNPFNTLLAPEVKNNKPPVHVNIPAYNPQEPTLYDLVTANENRNMTEFLQGGPGPTPSRANPNQSQRDAMQDEFGQGAGDTLFRMGIGGGASVFDSWIPWF